MYLPSGTDIKLAFTGIKELLKKGMLPELNDKIMDLREMVQGLRETCVGLREENMLLKAKLAEKEAATFEDGVYWTTKQDSSKDGPFCLPCHDNNGKLVRLTKDRLFFRCPVPGCAFFHQHTKNNSRDGDSVGGPNTWMAR